MDFGKAAMLLHVIDKARQWPNLKHIHDAAMQELVDMKYQPEEAQTEIPDEPIVLRAFVGPRPTIRADEDEELERRV